jgi:lysophospholipase L1-like esterase
MRRRLVVPAVITCLLLITTTTAIAKPGKGGGGGGGGAGVVVSLGDSYISGEAGRWLGNSLDNNGSRDGTDRAYVKQGGGYYDVSRVYLQGTDSDGCHRADVADVHWVTSAATTINLACSGAVTQNIFRASNGGSSQKGWAPQADQLAAVAASNDVTAIVLSIGGNDLGFSDIIISCTEDWFTSPSWWENHCHPEEQQNVDNRMPAAMAGVAKAIDEIRAVMAAAGDTDYRLVLRSYPSPIPRASENRYSESGWSRWDYGGCPFWNEDSDWARDSLVPQISSNLRSVAASKGVEFMDLQNLLQGREVCAVTTSHVTSSPSGAAHEWVRWLNTGFSQGEAQESLHPNAYGQQAAGSCLKALLATTPGNYTCTNVPGAGPGTVSLSGT